MPQHTERSTNAALAQVLRDCNARFRNAIQAEQLRSFRNSKAQPDLIIIDAVPVVNETELIPALTVERDALAMLGLVVELNRRRVDYALACRPPDKLRHTSQELTQSIFTVQIEFCVLSQSDTETER